MNSQTKQIEKKLQQYRKISRRLLGGAKTIRMLGDFDGAPTPEFREVVSLGLGLNSAHHVFILGFHS